MAGRTVRATWEGRPVDAWIPGRIVRVKAAWSAPTVRATERATAAVIRMGDRSAGPLEVPARLLLRSEGLASSAIEGVRAPVAEVALIEAARDGRTAAALSPETAGWIADNLAVVAEALSDPRPVTPAKLRAWHKRLMSHADLDPTLVGRWRDRLGWVGGANPLVAAYVPPPPSHIADLVDDLVAFLARTDLDAISQAAIAHGQFEVIHPFADGNGRIGRILISRTLSSRLAVPVPPPVSVQLARHVGGYLAGLTRFRQGDVEGWVRWFAEAVEAAAAGSSAVLDAAAALLERWRTITADLRQDAVAHRIIDLLPAHPALTAGVVADLCDVSPQAARLALAQLAERGIVAPVEGPRPVTGRPAQWWVAGELLNLVGGRS